jgi:GMP synthase (glutamine-hydrolysing)
MIELGAEMNVDELEDHPFLRNARDFVRAAVDARRPILGVCLGAQMLARALEADVKPSSVKEIGFRRVLPTQAGKNDPVLSVFTEDVPVFQWHEDAFSLPVSATLLCRGDPVALQAFRAGERSYAVQFHFEVDRDGIAAWCDETDPEELRAEWGVTKEALLDEARRCLPAQQAAARRALQAWLARL